jgi:tRNA (guanine-N7-)-methyltransferase
VTDPERHYQFYGRRKGHALRRHHLQLVNELLPTLRFDSAMLGDWHDARLEIGFGGGEHLAHQAALHPETLMIGAEPFLNGVAKLLALIEERKLENIRIHDGDARYLFEQLPDSSLSGIYLLYPDPWPKLRHHKRRMVNTETLAEFHRMLKVDGFFVFATDMEDYAEWTFGRVAACKGFAGPVNDPLVPPDDWVETRYERKARRAGRKSQYLIFRKLLQAGN